MYDINRFLDAQSHSYDQALKEIMNGKKETHWIWYIFPQLKDLGRSQYATYYGIEDIEEAKAYYAHPILRHRLLEITSAFLNLEATSALAVFGKIDAKKVRSCMTLFKEASGDELFGKVLAKYYDSKEDEETLKLLNKL